MPGIPWSADQISIPLALLQAYADYQDIMVLTEDLIKAAAHAVTGGLEVDYQGQHLDFGQPFRRVSMHDLVKEVIGEAHPAFRATAGCLGIRAHEQLRKLRQAGPAVWPALIVS